MIKDKELEIYVQKMTELLRKLQFDPVTPHRSYCHMGATITDSVLQAGLNYQNVVYPRVQNLLENYAGYKSTSDFLILIQTIPLNELISINNQRKLTLINDLTWFFFNNGIEYEHQLADWICNIHNAKKLLSFNGVGDKTVDYLKSLVGIPSVAIDRHLFSFLKVAGISIDSYHDASIVYQKTAEMMSMSEYELDRKIWSYMSHNYSLYQCYKEDQLTFFDL